MSEIQFRGYRDTDLEALYQLDRVCFETPFRFSRAAMRSYITASNAHVVVAEAGSAIAGFCIVHCQRMEDGDIAYITTIDVHSSFRRQGIASEMLQRAELQAKANGQTAMMLHVLTENKAAISFYKGRGYAQIELHRDFYGAGLHAYVCRKALVSSH